MKLVEEIHVRMILLCSFTRITLTSVLDFLEISSDPVNLLNHSDEEYLRDNVKEKKRKRIEKTSIDNYEVFGRYKLSDSISGSDLSHFKLPTTKSISPCLSTSRAFRWRDGFEDAEAVPTGRALKTGRRRRARPQPVMGTLEVGNMSPPETVLSPILDSRPRGVSPGCNLPIPSHHSEGASYHGGSNGHSLSDDAAVGQIVTECHKAFETREDSIDLGFAPAMSNVDRGSVSSRGAGIIPDEESDELDLEVEEMTQQKRSVTDDLKLIKAIRCPVSDSESESESAVDDEDETDTSSGSQTEEGVETDDVTSSHRSVSGEGNSQGVSSGPESVSRRVQSSSPATRDDDRRRILDRAMGQESRNPEIKPSPVKQNVRSKTDARPKPTTVREFFGARVRTEGGTEFRRGRLRDWVRSL